MRRLIFPLLLYLIASGWRAIAADHQPPQWIVVTTPALRDCVEPLCEQRRADGMHVQVVLVAGTDSNESARIKKEIERLCVDQKSPSYVLLVGAPVPAKADPKAIVPTLTGEVGRMKGLPTDHGYGVCDANLLPSVSVGRFPARNAAEAKAMVEKTLGFERAAMGDWQHRLTALVGNPGGLTEWQRRMAEAVGPTGILMRFSQLDPAWTGRFIIHAAGSPYTVADGDLHGATLDLLREGQFFTCYLGHSAAPGFWSGGARFFDRQDWSTLNIPKGTGVFFTCGCFACQLAGNDGEGYALAAARNPTGPVAVIGSYAESYSAPGLLALDGLLGCWHGPDSPARLADYWLAVQKGLARGPIDPLTFFALDQVDGSHGKSSLEEQRREHLEMWTLLGDPALRMPVSGPAIQLKSSASATPGKELTITGRLPAASETTSVHVTLERPLAAPLPGIAPVPDDPQRAREVINANRLRANTLALQTQSVEARDGQFKISLNIPSETPWEKIIVRATAESPTGTVYGVLAVPVTK